MTRVLIDQTLWHLGQSFDMLFASLKDLRDDDWNWLPDGGARSIRAIVGHVISVKLMYDNHAFGDASMTWEDPRFDEAQSPMSDAGFSPQALVAWLRDAQLEVLRSVDALGDDAELQKPRPVNWGGTRSTRWIITQLINHDAFHAGEINHLRSLHHRNDRWEWEAE